MLDEQPLRNSYAKPGGPKADLDWARAALWRQGLEITGAPVQVKTWNLSSVWRLPLGTEDAWLKVVPPMFQHEGALIDALGPDAPVPRLFGFEPGRLIMHEIPGADLFDATLDQRLAMIDMLVRLQRDWVPRTDELLALGLPDWRAPALGRAIADVFERTRGELTMPQARAVERFIAGLDARFAALAECGLPDSFVHGDYHSGNVRGDAHHLTILDWGDAGVGHPLLDYTAFMRPSVDRSAAAIAQRMGDRVARGVSNIRPQPRMGPDRADRAGSQGRDLPEIPRQHRAVGAHLSPRRSAGLLAGRRRDRLLAANPRTSATQACTRDRD